MTEPRWWWLGHILKSERPCFGAVWTLLQSQLHKSIICASLRKTQHRVDAKPVKLAFMGVKLRHQNFWSSPGVSIVWPRLKTPCFCFQSPWTALLPFYLLTLTLLLQFSCGSAHNTYTFDCMHTVCSFIATHRHSKGVKMINLVSFLRSFSNTFGLEDSLKVKQIKLQPSTCIVFFFPPSASSLCHLFVPSC